MKMACPHCLGLNGPADDGDLWFCCAEPCRTRRRTNIPETPAQHHGHRPPSCTGKRTNQTNACLVRISDWASSGRQPTLLQAEDRTCRHGLRCTSAGASTSAYDGWCQVYLVRCTHWSKLYLNLPSNPWGELWARLWFPGGDI
jgi:hypothetical protein